jgi:hypothetical protein
MSSIDAQLARLETQWQVALPPAFHRLHQAFEYPYVRPCEFYSLEELLDEMNRWRGMLPQFLPFAHDGGDNFFGYYVPSFYPTPDGHRVADFPVLAWDHEYDHYHPVASGTDAFLRWCVLKGRYDLQDENEELGDVPLENLLDEEAMLQLTEMLGTTTREPLPRNDHEFYERMLFHDGQNTEALLHTGTWFLAKGDAASLERARDYFARASEISPWFADPYYLLAETYHRTERNEEAFLRWWQVVQCPIALSMRTTDYDIGYDHLEAETYDAAISKMILYSEALPASIRTTSLWKKMANKEMEDQIGHENFYTPSTRLTLAESLEQEGDDTGAEREMLNALTLATDEADMEAAYRHLIAFYESRRRTRDAYFCRRDAERKS